jgi:uncharacterized protein (DUF1778 family)
MAQKSLRTTRVEARISPEGLDIVKRAAEIQGRSVSDFMVAAAQEAARRTVEQAQIVRLSVKDQRALLAALLDPPQPNRALKRAKAAHARLVSSAR